MVAGAGWTVEAVHTPGHTSNHLCFALREEGALFSGDHVMGWSTSVIAPPDGDMVAFLASLRLLLDRDDVSYWPTHGPQITDPKALVRAYLEHRQERTDQVVAALRDGPATIVRDRAPDLRRGGQDAVGAGGHVDVRPSRAARGRGPRGGRRRRAAQAHLAVRAGLT